MVARALIGAVPRSGSSSSTVTAAAAAPAGSNSSSTTPHVIEVGKRYSHSAAFHPGSDSIFVFGGCTSSATTFCDLWRLDLTTRTWHLMQTTGTYPSPKACAVLVRYYKLHNLFKILLHFTTSFFGTRMCS